MKQVLEEKGILSELRAKIRAEIYESLQIGKQLGVTDAGNQKSNDVNDCGDATVSGQTNKKWNRDEMVIHELIKEYMKFHGLQHSLSVFASETSGDDKVRLKSVFSLSGSSTNENPLIYEIVEKSKQ